MEAIDRLTEIRDREYAENIRELSDCFVAQIDPLKVILFGSFADGSYTADSDYDFYIVIDDDKSIQKSSYLANKSVRNKMKRPVDILVTKKTRFEQKSKAENSLMIENEILSNGILLYDRDK